MFTVRVPAGAGPGTLIQVQTPYGNLIQVNVPDGVSSGSTFQVMDPVAGNLIGAPGQHMMAPTACGDLFNGASSLYIKQEFEMVELCGIEAKQRYRVSVPNGTAEGHVFLYITEESDCTERICCGPNRSLKLKVHQGDNKAGPVALELHKPLSCQGCCCLRPNFDVVEHGQKLGHIDDPCTLCMMDQKISDASGKMLFQTEGMRCQLGFLCPCCVGIYFNAKKDGQSVARIEKMPLDCEDCSFGTNRFLVNFDQTNDPIERKMLLASAMLIDLAYFEKTK